jgi:hypothetical protein
MHKLCQHLSEVKTVPVNGPRKPGGLQEAEAPIFYDSRHMNVVRLSGLSNRRLCPLESIPGTHFCWRLSRPQDHSAAG